MHWDLVHEFRLFLSKNFDRPVDVKNVINRR
jgi:hypothetical protein